MRRLQPGKPEMRPRGHLFLTHVSLQVLSPYLKRIASLHWYENASPRVQVARTDLPRALPLLLPLPSLVALTRRTSDWDTASKSSREVSLQLCTKPFFWSSPLSCHNLASACGMSNVGRLSAEKKILICASTLILKIVHAVHAQRRTHLPT